MSTDHEDPFAGITGTGANAPAWAAGPKPVRPCTSVAAHTPHDHDGGWCPGLLAPVKVRRQTKETR